MVNDALALGNALVKPESPHSKWRGGVVGQAMEVRLEHVGRVAPAKPGERHVWLKAAEFAGNPLTQECVVDALAELVQTWMTVADSEPEHLCRLPRWERAASAQGQQEGFDPDAPERGGERIQRLARAFAEKSQREMQLAARRPGKRMGWFRIRRQFVANRVGQVERQEDPGHATSVTREPDGSSPGGDSGRYLRDSPTDGQGLSHREVPVIRGKFTMPQDVEAG